MRIPFLTKRNPLKRKERSKKVKKVAVSTSPDQVRIQRQHEYEKRLNKNLERRSYGK